MTASPLPNLADPERLARALGVPATNDRLLDVLAQASGRFRGDTKRTITRVDNDTITIDGTGTANLYLPNAPIHGAPEVEVQGTPMVYGEDFTVSRAKAILRRSLGHWPDELDAIEVTYSHGYPDDEIPEDIQDVVLERAAMLFNVRAGVSSYTVGGEMLQFGGASVGTTDAWRKAIERYSIEGARA